MTVRQQELLEELAILDAELAGLYRQGLRLIPEVEDSGAAHLLGHAGRELMLGVVDAVIEEGWSLSERELLEIPDDERYRGKIARSLSRSPSDRSVSQWLELYSAFVAAAHYRRGDLPPDPDKLRLSFARLEQLLYGRIGPHFQIQAELDELLAIADPNESHVEQLQSILLRPQQRRYFFGRLTHSVWLRLLDRMEAFNRPPERRVHPDGSWQVVAWPEGEYLTRVARDEPDAVVQIVEKIPTEIENPAVWRVVADIANHVSPEIGRRLAPRLVRAAGKILPVLFADGIIKLIQHLADADYPEAFDLAAVLLFVPNAGDIKEVSPYSSRSNWIFPRLWGTHFSRFTEEALPSLERNNAERTASLLLRKLNQIAAVVRKLNVTYLLRPRIRHSARRYSDDVAGQFVEAVSQLLGRFASAGRENARCVLEMLARYDDKIFMRLKYQVVAVAGEHMQEELDSLLSTEIAVEPGDLGREIALVLREQYGNASDSAREIFRYALERGPGPEAVARRLHSMGLDKPTSSDIADIKHDWQRMRLLWFRGNIPTELQRIAEELDVWGTAPSFEEQELAEVGSYSGPGSAWGEPRPFTSESLSQRTPEEIARLIVGWRPDERLFETGTTRGFELSLQELIAEHPLKAIDIWQAAEQRLPARFTRALLDGLRDAYRAGVETFEWRRIVSLVRATVDQALTEEDTPASTRRDLFRSVVDMLEEGTSHDSIPQGLEEEIWSALTTIIRSPLVWEEEEELFGSFDRLLTAALNRTGSRAIRAALHTGLWSYRLREKEDIAEASRVAEEHLAPLLNEVIGRTGSGRVTAEVVIGQFLPQLQLIAPVWFENHLTQLLHSGAVNPLENPVWGAYVVHGRFYDSTFEVLRPWYVKAAEPASVAAMREISEDDDWSLTRSQTEHVLIAVLRGLASVGDPDELVETTFTTAPASDRRHAYWSIFHAWSDAETQPPEAFISRLLAFWEWRLERIEQLKDLDAALTEAQGLGWFLRTPYLPAQEVIRLAGRTTHAAQGKLEAQVDWDRLYDLSLSNTDAVYDIVEKVLLAQLSEAHHFIPVGEVRPILRTALDTGGPSTCARARRLVNRLGEAGYDDFRDLLE